MSLGENLIRAASLWQCNDDGSGELYSLPFALNGTLGLGNGGFARYHDINTFTDAHNGAACSTGEVDQAIGPRGSVCDIGAVEEF